MQVFILGHNRLYHEQNICKSSILNVLLICYLNLYLLLDLKYFLLINCQKKLNFIFLVFFYISHFEIILF